MRISFRHAREGASGSAAQLEQDLRKMEATCERLRAQVEGPAAPADERARDGVDAAPSDRRPLLHLGAPDASGTAGGFVLLGSAGAPGIEEPTPAPARAEAPRAEDLAPQLVEPPPPEVRAPVRAEPPLNPAALASFKKIAVSVSDNGGLNSVEERELRETFLRLPASDRGAALDFLLERGDEQGFVACERVAGDAAVSIGAFEKGVRGFRDKGGLNRSEEQAIENAFVRLPASERREALESLLSSGDEEGYLLCQARAGQTTVGVEAFLEATTSFADRGGFSDAELKSLKDAFARLSVGEQGAALDVLLRDGNETLYTTFSPLAGIGARVTLEGFAAGTTRFSDKGGFSKKEFSAMVDALQRLDRASRGEALSSLLATGDEELYCACCEAGGDATVSLDAFRAAAKHFADKGGYNSNESKALQDAMRRLEPANRGPALDSLLLSGDEEAYISCAAAAGAAPVRLEAFEKAAQLFADKAGYNKDELKAATDAFQRLDRESQTQALAFLLQVGNEDLYSVCSRHAKGLRLDAKAFAAGAEAFLDLRGLNKTERNSIKDAFSRLSRAEQDAALNDLLVKGFREVYKACAG